jgi:hypothetical protein
MVARCLVVTSFVFLAGNVLLCRDGKIGNVAMWDKRWTCGYGLMFSSCAASRQR